MSSFSRIPELDGVRGVAILAVVLLHLDTSVFKYGWLGVDLFFILSGYLITSLLLKEYQSTQTINFRAFYTRRALRLLPAVAVFCFVASPAAGAGTRPAVPPEPESPTITGKRATGTVPAEKTDVAFNWPPPLAP